MSDVEGRCLQTAPSITSDGEQDVSVGVRSLSSIHFHQHQGHKATMSGDRNYSGFLPGYQRPPHHRVGHGDHQDSTRPPPAPLKREQSTHEWSLTESQSQSAGDGSAMKEDRDIPVFSLSSGSRLPRSDSHFSNGTEQREEPEQNFAEGDQTPLEGSRKARSKDRKKKKSRRSKESGEMAMQDMNPQAALSGPEEYSNLRKDRRKKHPEASSMQSTGTYTIDTGAENPAYERTEAVDNTVRMRKQVQLPIGRDSLGVIDSATEDETESNNHVDISQAQRESSDTMMTQRSVTMNAATIGHSAMTSEGRRVINQNYTAWYISSNIVQRECNVYARDGRSAENACQCGRSVEWHKDKGLKANKGTDHVKWHPKTHTELMPCDSFGEILFRGFGSQSHNSPYMRVDDKCDMDKVWSVLTECWQLPKPRMLISVTGGAKRFYLRPRLKNILKQGLVNAAVSTGAWIITGGTATGVMEFVGEAAQEYIQTSGNPEGNKCVALGIAPWGAVANNIALDGEGEEGLFPADYCFEDIKNEKKKKSAPLDHNHTHFLLVDNGTEGKFGTEIEFRTSLESYISKIVETGVTETQSVNVPTVLIVVEGGINTMKTVQESISHNIPVVVIDGSGRAADFIAFAYRLTKDVIDEDCSIHVLDFDDIMVKKARYLFEWRKSMGEDDIQREIYDALRYLKACLKNRKLINIFNLDKADSVKDIDRAILYALLKANKSDVNSQLALALAWNRCDIARHEIFTPENRHKWQQAELYNAMFTALVQNRADFVQLFLDNGVDLKRFLTTKTLWNLYCNCVADQTDISASLLRYLISYLRQTWAAFLLCRGTPDFENFPEMLTYINKVIVHLLRNQSFKLYEDHNHVVENETPSMKWKGDRNKCQPMSSRIESRKSLNVFTKLRPKAPHGHKMSRRRTKVKFEDLPDFPEPERELFIWALLFNRRELTHLFWRLGKDHIGSALFGSALLYRLSELAEDEEEAEIAKDMADHSDECERWAVSILSECYSRDKQLTHRLLVRELDHWGRLTLFKMAEEFELMEFTEHSACQTKISSIWKGRMALYTSEMKIFVCTILPILVPFIKFTVDPKDKNEEENDFVQEMEITSDGKLVSTGLSPQHENQVGPSDKLPDTDGDGLGFIRSQTRRRKHSLASKFKKVNLFNFTTDNINIVSAIYFFYQAPVTKFFGNVIAYIIFMGLFTYTVLVKLGPVTEEDSPSLQEYLTWGWLSTMIMEEIRQLFIRDQHSMKYKYRSWFDNIWNRFDAAMYSLFILSIFLRYLLTGEDFVGARVTYSITLAMFVLRFMQYFYVEKNMGPKVIMIRKMLTDLMFFFFILLVFVVSFGVAYHANMFPQAPPSWSILVNVLYFPYFQMYGELFLENLKGDDVDGCTRNETIWREDPFKRCPSETAVVPILLAVYMILTNILLVNLLIAMFSYTFQTVQDNSTQVWRFYRLSLVAEYFDRPSLVPPLIIINHFFRVFRWVFFKNTGKGKGMNSFKWDLSPEEHNRLSLFEKSAMENHITVSKQRSKLTLDSRVQSTAKRLDTVMEELERIKESIQQHDQVRASAPADTSGDDAGGGGASTPETLQKERELMDRSPIQSTMAPFSR
ncbi:hypothetical protein V1264_011657 [Littorina saxatilis]